MSSQPSSRAADNRLDRIFGALSNHTRRAMLARLRRGPSMVTDLARPFAMSLPAASKHLRVLEHAGLVVRKVDGRVHHCALDPATLREADRWLAAYRAFWEGTLDSFADYVEASPVRAKARRRR